MSQRTFHFRLRSIHRPPERSTSDLVVEFLSDTGLWEPQQLSLTMPGFRIYLISLLLCQHFYLVANAREKAIATMQERMKLCPISRNLPDHVSKTISLHAFSS